jgi:hypothetical protein
MEADGFLHVGKHHTMNLLFIELNKVNQNI